MSGARLLITRISSAHASPQRPHLQQRQHRLLEAHPPPLRTRKETPVGRGGLRQGAQSAVADLTDRQRIRNGYASDNQRTFNG